MRVALTKRFIAAAVIIAILALLAGCAAKKTPGTGKEAGSKEQVLVGTGRKSQVTLPSGWSSRTDLHESAELQASLESREMYFIALADNKQAFTRQLNLDQYYDVIKGNYNTSVKNAAIGQPVSLTIGSYPARQFTVSGDVNNLKISYLVTVLETSDSFYQLVAWTLQYRFGENKADLIKITNSFREL